LTLAQDLRNVTAVDNRPVIDIRIRISRRFVFWVVAILVAFFILSLALTTMGHSSGGLKMGPVQSGPGR
jgi:hypothetical protein